MSNSTSGHKTAQRLYAANECVRCGLTQSLHRHHKDRDPSNNDPANVEILCVPCHAAEHRRLKPVACKVCAQQFQPKRTRRSTVCGPTCLAVLGRMSALKRWSPALQSE
jgi:5-methylcytosine-specific restriction endonuclease McrA